MFNDFLGLSLEEREGNAFSFLNLFLFSWTSLFEPQGMIRSIRDFTLPLRPLVPPRQLSVSSNQDNVLE